MSVFVSELPSSYLKIKIILWFFHVLNISGLAINKKMVDYAISSFNLRISKNKMVNLKILYNIKREIDFCKSLVVEYSCICLLLSFQVACTIYFVPFKAVLPLIKPKTLAHSWVLLLALPASILYISYSFLFMLPNGICCYSMTFRFKS